VAGDFAGRNVHPALAEKIIHALRAAGLKSTPTAHPLSA